MRMHIRRGTLADCAELARLHRGTIRSVNSRDYPPDIIDSWARRTSAKKFRETHETCIRYVAIEAGKIIGFGDVVKVDGNLGGIYIHKDFIGKGVGTLLIKQLEKDAKARGATTWDIHASITAKPFYEARGFRVVEKIIHHTKMQYKEHHSLL